jgi:hypothetical protein
MNDSSSSCTAGIVRSLTSVIIISSKLRLWYEILVVTWADTVERRGISLCWTGSAFENVGARDYHDSTHFERFWYCQTELLRELLGYIKLLESLQNKTFYVVLDGKTNSSFICSYDDF